MLYEIYFIKHYYLFFKENNFSLISQNRHPLLLTSALNIFPYPFFMPYPYLIFFSTGDYIRPFNIFPYPFFISSVTGNHIRSQYLPVPVSHFFPCGNPYPYLISSGTGNHIRYQYLPVPVFHVFPYENANDQD